MKTITFFHLRVLGLVTLTGSMAKATPGLAAPPCYGRLNDTARFEEVCFTVLKNGTGGLSLREYRGASALATLVEYEVGSAATVNYQEALINTTAAVIAYFAGEGNELNASLLAARTVPFVLRPPTPTHNFWTSHLALAPSQFPPGGSPSPPDPVVGGVSLTPLGVQGVAVTLAVQRKVQAPLFPEPSDFYALCAKLEAGIETQLPGWAVDEASPYTPAHARFWTEEFFSGPWTLECWMGVKKV